MNNRKGSSSVHLQDPLFSIVEIEINTHCNRSCNYCPNLVAAKPPRLIKIDVFQRMAQELGRVGFRGRLSLHSYSEPFLHPQLADIVTVTRCKVPEAKIVLMTNGDFLDDKNYERLVNAGVFYFMVTSHSGMSFPKRPRQRVMFPDHHYFTNRGGIMASTSHSCLSSACLAPSEMLVVDIDGNVIRCYEDFYRRHIMGNLLQTPVELIWNSPKFRLLRTSLREGRRDSIGGICTTCNNRNHEKPENFLQLLTLGDG